MVVKSIIFLFTPKIKPQTFTVCGFFCIEESHKMSIPAAYVGVIIIWSTTPLAIKWSNEAGHFLFGASGRMALGALLCLLIIALLRVEFPWHRAARRSYLAVSVAIYGAMMGVYWGAQFIPSGLISVLFGLTPIVTSVLTAFWLGERTLNLSKWIGMILGLLGLALIFSTNLGSNTHAVKGLLAVLLSVFLHSISTVWVKRLNVTVSPLAMTCGGLLIALPLYGLTWLLLGESFPSHLAIRTVLSIVYLGVFGSVVGFVLYYYVLKHIEATRVALITLITPITALLLGQGLNGEVIPMTVWIGAGVVLSGLGMYQWGERLVK
jgi:drug/metabolite transporter (DMT)-like permease